MVVVSSSLDLVVNTLEVAVLGGAEKEAASHLCDFSEFGFVVVRVLATSAIDGFALFVAQHAIVASHLWDGHAAFLSGGDRVNFDAVAFGRFSCTDRRNGA